jgi:asparagine synthase (glutamine-hydrolysing)
MFAFAIFDRQRRRLVLARDPLGIKPLFYWHDVRGFAFASEIKSLLALPGVSRDIDPDSLGFYLSLQYTPPARTIYSAVHKLPAGEVMTVDLASREARRATYWSPPAESPRPSDVRELRSRLETAAAAWMMSDVPVGVSLSGGIDSSALVGLLASKGYRLKTWTLGFDDAAGSGSNLDERRMARLVADRWGTEHHEIILRSDSLLDDLDTMVAQLDEPYGGGLPSWYVFREMSREVKVALTGTGADELFGNYGKWRRMRPPRLGWATRRTRSLQSHGLRECLTHPHGSLFKVQFGERDKRRMAGGNIASVSVPAMLESLWRQSGCHDPRQAVACIDMRTQLPEEFLMMTDRFSMYWSVEARTPFLDRELVDYALRLPTATRSPDGALKGALIDAVRDLLPSPLLGASKRGFVLPTAAWLRGALKPLLHHYFSSDFLKRQGLFHLDLHKQLVEPHLAGHNDLSEKIWTLLMFQLWWQRNAEQAT